MRLLLTLSVVAAVAAPAPALAQGHHDQNCATKAPPPAELSAWSRLTAGSTSKDAAGTGTATLVPGKGITTRLFPSAEVNYLAAPERSAKAGTFGGLFALEAAEAGSYRIALGGGGWIDVLTDGKPVASSDHGRGQPCTGIGKTVTFPLPAGRHLIQVSGVAEPTLSILVVKAP